MSITLLNIRDEVKKYTADFVQSNNSNIDKQINYTRKQISRYARISDLLFTDIITTSNGVQSYSIPTRFKEEYYVLNTTTNKIIELWVSDIYLEEKIFNNLPSQGSPIGYQVRGSKFYFFPIPDGAYTIEVLSYHYPIVLANDNDTDYLNDEYDECIVKGTVYRLFSQVGSADLALQYYQEYQLLLDEVAIAEKDKWQQKLLMYKKRFPEKSLLWLSNG